MRRTRNPARSRAVARVATAVLSTALALTGCSHTSHPSHTAHQDTGKAAEGSRPVPPDARHIALKGAVNVRDLGGYRTSDGKQLRYGVVFRGDALGKLTPADLAVTSKLGLKSVVDFRLPVEVRTDGADRLPKGASAIPLPIDDTGLYERTTAAIGSRDPAQQQKALGDGKGAQTMQRIYRTFVTEAGARHQFAKVLDTIADGKRLPLLFHCTSGKDRTGWMSYVLLRAVGVPARTAEADYLLSNDIRKTADEKTREGLKKSGVMKDPQLIVPLQEVRKDYLGAALTEADHRYGSFDAYLSKGLGLDAGTLHKLRTRLLK
ncbi:tyrosine-protein phosphatase [Streptomyces sp. NBC_01306]|uniref:tyrosine-protein phosphatase n=1 Tax=Streptomyces sp. NBC_01306 TaxID=2903819 RepID=UPI00225BAC4D|nr:tyrosine-protein phosphatase [Streptomyces sp. NBC_01306]MCX4728520.1 tyrosine-protein phosphatase [Streptomyces sp. NBC_01306]